MWKSLNRERSRTTRRSCAGWSRRGIRMLSTSDWCRTISIPIRLPRCMRRFHRVKPGVFCNGSSSIIRGIHGSWLNMAEIEIGIIEQNALSRRLEDETVLHRHVLALETERNDQHRTISWRFTSRDARTKLQDRYPVKDTYSD